MNESEKYKSEVQKKWGKTDAYKEYSEKANGYTEQKHNELADGTAAFINEAIGIYCRK